MGDAPGGDWTLQAAAGWMSADKVRTTFDVSAIYNYNRRTQERKGCH